jgi:hypothetical protein
VTRFAIALAIVAALAYAVWFTYVGIQIASHM